jgi:two-component system chemotaxis sensor kinase CheA
MSNELAQDANLLNEFLTESEELLQQADQDLVTLESAPEDEELLNRVFRAFHTIKGTSGFMGFTQVVELTHQAEDVLNLLRKKERKITRQTMDVLLVVLDQLRAMMEDIRQNTPRQYDLSALLGQLRKLQAPEGDQPMLGEIMVAQKVINHAELEDSLSQANKTGQKLGEVLVDKQLASASQVREALVQQAAPAHSREAARTIRVDVHKLDELMDLVGELVLERNRLVHLSRDFTQQQLSQEKFEASFNQSTVRLNFLTEEMQVTCLKTRMVPIDVVFRKFPRMVRDISRNLGKEVELEVRGEDTELDKTVVEEIGDPLVHLVRNSLDHGVETPEIRTAQGKPRKGKIRLEACQEGDYIIVRVIDDGAGIDPERIARKAVEKGFLTPERVQAMSTREILNLIFLPGFSTAERVSDVSGRGVGMDVVCTNLKRLNGVVELDSSVGRGSTVTLKLPLTLAILPALLVRVAEETYALPLRAVLETVRIRSQDVHRVENEEVLRLRDQVIPLRRLRRFLNPTDRQSESDAWLFVVIVGVGGRKVGLVVDELLGQEETVIKPLGSYLRHVPGVAGATISGDGRVRLILDPAGLSETREAVLS